jgi:hypothetical protein
MVVKAESAAFPEAKGLHPTLTLMFFSMTLLHPGTCDCTKNNVYCKHNHDVAGTGMCVGFLVSEAKEKSLKAGSAWVVVLQPWVEGPAREGFGTSCVGLSRLSQQPSRRPRV